MQMTRLIQYFDWFFFRLVWLCLFRLKVRGQENFADYPTRNLVFYANHSSYFDPFLASINIPLSYYLHCREFKFLASRRQAIGKWYSPIIRAMGAYPLPEGKKGYESVMPETISLVREGYPVMIFPVPYLRPDICPEEARPGICYLAEQTKATLVPVCIKNVSGWKIKELFGRHRRVEVIYGKPVSYQEFAALPGDCRQKAAALMEIVKEMSTK